jgi:putative oxidoreductase
MVSYPTHQKHTDAVLLAVRLLLAFEFLWHGVPKLLNPAAAAEQFIGWGFPGIVAPLVGIVEVVAAVLFIVGYLTPVAVIAALGVISVALLTVQIPMGGVHAALERDVLILLTLLVLLSFGPGRFAITDRLPQPNPLSRETQG